MLPAIFRLDTSHPTGAHGWATPSFTPAQLLVCHADTQLTHLYKNNTVIQTWANPLDALTWMPSIITTLPPHHRWVGYLSYDLAHLFETLPQTAANDLDLPLFVFALSEEPPTGAPIHLDSAGHTGFKPVQIPPHNHPAAVKRAIEYIRAGDIFQVNLAQRLTRTTSDSPETLYTRLITRTPAWYGARFSLPAGPWGEAFSLLSNSPELFFHLDASGGITTRPIKGTRPRLPGQDLALLESIKDQAELHMIVDLHRNDLGRVCQIGSVKVTVPREIETHPTVYQGVSTITGQLKPHTTFVDLLRAVFPAGSITGAPKIRAMQIIDELEPVQRGPYCGAIGYLDSSGEIQFSVAIRNIILKNGQAHVSVGGGIVADSEPDAEYEETLVKARALLDAFNP